MVLSRLESRVSNRSSIPSDEEIRLRELNHSKDKLLSIVSHDLRSAVGCVGSLIEMLEEQLQAGNVDDAMRIAGLMRRSARDADEILDDLASWSRDQGTGIAFHLETLEIGPLIESEIERLRPVAARKEIRLEYVAPEATPLRGDAYLLRIILRNLLSNAIKYSPTGEAVRVEAERLPGEWRFRVTDRGMGMSAQVQELLLKIDNRKRVPGTAGEAGAGFGLLLCEEYVQRHGGRFFWESEPNRGSTFTFTIPDLIG